MNPKQSKVINFVNQLGNKVTFFLDKKGPDENVITQICDEDSKVIQMTMTDVQVELLEKQVGQKFFS